MKEGNPDTQKKIMTAFSNYRGLRESRQIDIRYYYGIFRYCGYIYIEVRISINERMNISHSFRHFSNQNTNTKESKIKKKKKKLIALQIFILFQIIYFQY